ncbi:hypothetical protein DYQ86_03915 [Acidobacteria bacterium AB60]|nr:hypothetical protein DYQ86_03915 [Acidobacteria bacterium AB60]
MKKSSLWLSALGALGAAIALAGCGQTQYFAGRTLPPSGLRNRVLVAIQNPSVASKGALEILDAYYDIRYKYNDTNTTFSIGGYSGALPVTIQNMPEEQVGAIYGSGDGSLTLADYEKESSSGAEKGLNGLSSSVFITRNRSFIFSASQPNHIMTVVDSGIPYALSLPGIYRVSVNPGGSAALAFVENSNYIYYPVKLNAAQTLAYSGGSGSWPKAAVDCAPQNAPAWCLFQAQSPDAVDATGTSYGAPLAFDRPVKAVFSNDGNTAYVLNCGAECGGTASSIALLPVGPMIFTQNQGSGVLPCNQAAVAPCPNAKSAPYTSISTPGGASNALIASSTMYVVGQQLLPDGLFTGNLTIVNLTNNSAAAPIAISDGAPGAMSRIIQADDNTLWIGMTKCTNGERYAKGQPYGCLTMFNTASNTVAMIEPYQGDATGIAAVTSLHKVYVAEGGQVYVYATTDGRALNNQYVTVTGTAWDVAYMDGNSDANNTVY